MKDIVTVTLDKKDETYQYTIYPKEKILGAVTITLVNAKDLQIAISSFWHTEFGTFTVKEKLPDGDYFVYLEENSIKSNKVMILHDAPVVINYTVVNNILGFNLKKSGYDYCTASHLEIDLSAHPTQKPLPECTIPLEYCKEENNSTVIPLRYSMKSSNATVYSAAIDIPVITTAPDVQSVQYSESRLTFTGNFTAPQDIYARIYQGRNIIADRILDASRKCAVTLASSLQYKVCLYYKNDYGTSQDSIFTDIISFTPEVCGCSYIGDKIHLKLTKSAIYKYIYNNERYFALGNSITMPATVTKVLIQPISGIATGPVLTYTVNSPAYYSFEYNSITYYQFANKPVSAPEHDITTDIIGKFTAYNGVYFQLSGGNDFSKLSISKNVIGAKTSAVQKDYEKMLRASVSTYAALQVLTQAILQYMPLTEEDYLYYRYQYQPHKGCVSLHPGMKLCVEYATYQNIPDSENADSKLNGFTGTGVSDYQVILYNGSITFSPFINRFINAKAFTVNPPQIMDAEAKMEGGSGECDLLFNGLRAPFVKLVYPHQYIDRNTAGGERYFENICILASNSLSSLDSAVDAMRNNSLSSDTNVAYNTFKGRAVLTPFIQISINQTLCYVALGITLSHVIASLGIHTPSTINLQRQSGNGPVPVHCSSSINIPLISGDIITGYYHANY